MQLYKDTNNCSEIYKDWFMKNIKKLIAAFFVLDLTLCVLVAVVLGKRKEELGSPQAVFAADRQMNIGNGSSKGIIEENYWNFVHKSYILVGNAPDYEFYKIVSEVPRNDYKPELFYREENGLMYYHDENGNRLSKVAVDVSVYQGDVNWQALADAGVDIVMIRAGFRGYGNGEIKTDTSFGANVQGAKAAGLRVGAYFFSQALNTSEGEEEASYVLNLAYAYGVDGPIAIDTELVADETARTYNLDITSRTDGVIGFCETVKASGYEPMIYANRNWYVQNLDMTRLGSYKLWVAQYVDTPDFPYLYNGWQYTDEGSIPGISGNIDLNVWFD